MRQTPPEKAVLAKFADEIAKRITRRTISCFQRMKETLAGEGYGFANVWDEICVQVQYEPSIFWDVYDDTVRSVVSSYVEALKKHEKNSLWFQTGKGLDWLYGLDENVKEIPPVPDDEVTDWLVNVYVYREAARWSNNRIREYVG
jgi:hypothetical protein